MKKYIIIGIDEAGRGPLAGPVSVGAVAVEIILDTQEMKFWKFLIPTPPKAGCAPTPPPATLSLASNAESVASAGWRSECGRGRISKTYFLRDIRDSKKLSAKQREDWFKIINKNFENHFSFVGEKIIDKIGIQKATHLAISRVLKKFSFFPDIVFLDGSIFAPKNYCQKTIIKGDEKIPLISAASIVAKVKRDAKMIYFHKKFPQYHFDVHKGYGTKLHYKMIKKYGVCPCHRRSFLKHCKQK